jgi:F-type H+-transporting ATPase subunit gamma
MAKTRDLKRRIRSVRKTRQITRTMEMVSTSKLKRASDRVRAARPYASHLTDVIASRCCASPRARSARPSSSSPRTAASPARSMPT